MPDSQAAILDVWNATRFDLRHNINEDPICSRRLGSLQLMINLAHKNLR